MTREWFEEFKRRQLADPAVRSAAGYPASLAGAKSAYVSTLLLLLEREVRLETWAGQSKSPSIAAACRPEFRAELCDRIERILYPQSAA